MRWKTATVQKMKFFIRDSLGKKLADLVTFTEEILNGKLHFLCSESKGFNTYKASKLLEL